MTQTPSSSLSSSPLIKGYLPVRLRLPRQPQLSRRGICDDIEDTEETFFFVREHQGRTNSYIEGSETASKLGTILFVANAPVLPSVSTKLLLKSIFGRFANVTRVTAVQNPRLAASASTDATNDSLSPRIKNATTDLSTKSSFVAWSDKQKLFQPTFLPHIFSVTEGKYAHVVFSSRKEMKKAKKVLEDLMSNCTSSRSLYDFKGLRKPHKRNPEGKHQRALILDKLDIQALSDESLQQREELIQLSSNITDDFDVDIGINNITRDDKIHSETTRKDLGVLAVAQRYKESCKFLKNRAKLMEECNLVMKDYEDAEEERRRSKEAAEAEPDSDGFITVSYSNAVGSKVEFEQSATATTPSRRKGNKRSRRKKAPIGSGKLKDFYRFQRADNRKRTMADLRRKFDEDVRKVKRLKEEKEYRPF